MARFQEIDELLVKIHSHLGKDDECYFLCEYTSGKNYKFSSANSLISNLKKKPSTRNTHQWNHKLRAMRSCSVAFGNAISHDWLRTATLVPVPPSKSKDHPEYDNRMRVICDGIPADFEIDVRELVIQTDSHEAAHESDYRPSPDELLNNYEINEDVAEPEPTVIGIVDDVLTAGSHYRAMHTILSERFPRAKIIGFFIARRVFPPDPEAVDPEAD